MFASATRARCAVRRQVLHRRAHHGSLLPSDLSCPYVQGEQCPLLSKRRRGGGSRLSAVFALPAGMLAGNTGLGGYSKYSFAGIAADQRERFGGRRCGSSCRAPGSWLAPSSPPVPPAPRGHAEGGGSDPSFALSQ